MLQLQRNVPPPVQTRRVDKRKKYPIESMQVGDFFFVPGKAKNTIRTYFATVGKQYGIKLKSDLIHSRRDEHNSWKPCDEDAPGATVGVGVWRIE